MENLSQIAIDLKTNGYSQALTFGDSAYIPKTKEYIRFIGKDIDDDFIRVPTLANLITSLSTTDYVLNHKYIGKRDGEDISEYRTDYRGFQITSENIWACLAKLWILVEGNK